ncbi:MAG: DUF222 domain-containing protein [Propionibacteriaceae bacterium]|nr:DUF222 domain-containing protein [Propionibacteriaceae bacterium]
MIESTSGPVGGSATLVDPRPEEVALVLEALVTTDADGADEQLEPWRLPDRRLLAELVEAQAQATRARARWLALLAEAERREATLQACGLPTANWLTNQNTHWARSAREELRFAVRLAEAPVVGEALGRGEVSVEQAQVIVTGLARLPIGLDAGQREQVAGHLVELAAEFGPYGLSRLANRAVEVVAPEAAEDADRRAIERIEAEQYRDRYLTWQRDPDGAWLLRGKLGKVAGQQLVGLLRALAARQRSAVLLAGDDIARTQAAADALVTLAEHYSSCRKSPRHGTDRPRVLVSIDYDVLLGRLGTATLLNTGEAISAAEARRLACDADILPMVLNGDSVPLDVGRKRRLFDSTLRQVLIARDQGCAFPGCDRDPADCEAHHRRPWWAGGVTSLANGVLLCSFHHHLVEPDPNAPPGSGWQLRLDVRGRPEFLPPGAERWRQHHRYRT